MRRQSLVVDAHRPPPTSLSFPWPFALEDHDDLRDCMGKVFLIGCGADYLRNVVGVGDEEDLCSRGREDEERGNDAVSPLFRNDFGSRTLCGTSELLFVTQRICRRGSSYECCLCEYRLRRGRLHFRCAAKDATSVCVYGNGIRLPVDA